MLSITFPNQKIVAVHKESLGESFLGINKNVWMAACRDLNYPSTILYLYLASNKNNYQFALSPAAIQTALGMPRTTYRDQIRNLINKGYLVESEGNRLDFYEIPQRKSPFESVSTLMTETALPEEECAFAVDYESYVVDGETGEIIEINNKVVDTDMELIDNTIFDLRKPIVKSEKYDGRTWSITDF